MEEEKEQAIQKLITNLVSKVDGITNEQVALARELYTGDERDLKEIEIELLAYVSSIAQTNAMVSMKTNKKAGIYALDIDAPIKGIYLSETQIDLMTITEIASNNELLNFIANCTQIDYSETQLQELQKMKLDLAKRKVFEDYRDTLIGTSDLRRAPSISLRKKLASLGLPNNVANEVITLYKEGKVEQATNYIITRLNLDFGTITSQAFKKHSLDYDDVKCSSYEEIAALAKKISDFDSITITSGKYSMVMNNGKFDPYHIKRELDFCKRHNIQARYHGLLTKDVIESFKEKRKEEIIETLRNYVSLSIHFINSYNAENRLPDGRPVIRTIDIFNELINLKKDKTKKPGYYNIWEQLGLTTEDLVDIFAPAIGNKEEGVKYVYNEAFVETEEKRQVQLALAKEIHSLAPELIDIFGTQMHITTEFKPSTIEKTFSDLQEFSDSTGIELAITEFDMHVPEKIIDRLKSTGKTVTEIAEYVNQAKLSQLNVVSNAAQNTNVEFSEVAYWSATDSMDHNKKRQGRNTLYGGLFGTSLQPKGVSEVVEYTPPFTRPSLSTDILGYLDTLNSMLEKQPIITPQDPPKKLVKKENKNFNTSEIQDDAGFSSFPQLLIITLLLVAILHILLM